MPQTDRNLALPGNPRYQPKDLQSIFGYDFLYRGVARVEIATLKTLHEIGIISHEEIAHLTPRVESELMLIKTTDVDKEERQVTHHDIRAWVNLAKPILGPLARWVHIPLTSYDVLDTGRILMYVEAHRQVVRQKIKHVVYELRSQVQKYAHTVQIGRTHGQHALPITVGFWLATFLSRIVSNARQMDLFASQLVGKISGAVGAYNAQVGLKFSDRCGEASFEERVLQKLGLKPAPISTQILPPEPLAYYLFSAVQLSAAIANFGRDCRHLMRSEIQELGEPFEQGQVGSSTMAHKRNPITFENLEGTGQKNVAEFQKVLWTLISEHQRDLVGSSVARDFPTIIVNLVLQLDTLLKQKKDVPGSQFIKRITVDELALKRNFEMNAHLVLAEPIYIALQMAGYSKDAHELVNHHAVPIATKEKILLIEAVKRLAQDPERSELVQALSLIDPDILSLFHNPAQYIGDATNKALQIADEADKYFYED